MNKTLAFIDKCTKMTLADILVKVSIKDNTKKSIFLLLLKSYYEHE